MERYDDGTEVKDPYSISISDLMAGVLIIFILALVSMILVYKESIENIKNINEQRAQILEEIHKKLPAEDKERVKLDAKNGILRIDADGISNFSTQEQKATAVFKLNESKLTPEGERLITDISEVILKMKNDSQYAPKWKVVDTIMIEGHTDSLPLNIDGRTNMDLSTERASYTWKFMDYKSGYAFSSMTNHDGQKLFSIAGYGEQRPLPNIDSKDSSNRRIEFRFIVKPVDEK